MKGKSVYGSQFGKELGEVEDLCFNESGHVTGIILNHKGIFKRDQFIPIQDVSSIGPDGIMIKNLQGIEKKSRKLRRLHDRHKGVIGKPLFTSEGEKLGLVEDVYFMEELGTIVGYEVTDGFFADMTEGRKVITPKSPVKIGEKVIVAELKRD